jgi:hypothetical protein
VAAARLSAQDVESQVVSCDFGYGCCCERRHGWVRGVVQEALFLLVEGALPGRAPNLLARVG